MTLNTFEQNSRVICDLPEGIKIWFADFCRRRHSTMSNMIRTLILSLKEQHDAEKAQEKQEK